MKHREPSRHLYLLIKAGFVYQGTSLTAWARTQGIDPSSARSAIMGLWDGPKGKALRLKAIEASKIEALEAAA